MFKSNSSLISLSEDIFVYKGFLSKEEASSLHSKVMSYPQDIWNSTVNPIEWYNGKTTTFTEDAKPLYEKINELVKETHTPTPTLSFSRMFPGDEMHVHTDTCGDDEATANDDFGTCAITEYGVVVYLNDCFSGGEIFYPDLNLQYKPVAGDLVIHNAMIRHGVKKVEVGTRYIYSTFLIKNSLKDKIIK